MSESRVIVPTLLRSGLNELFNLPDGIKSAITHIGVGTASYTPDAEQTAAQGEILRVPVIDSTANGDGSVMFYAEIADWTGELTPCYELTFYLASGNPLAIYSSDVVELALLAGSPNDLFYTLVLDAIPADKLEIVSTEKVFVPSDYESSDIERILGGKDGYTIVCSGQSNAAGRGTGGTFKTTSDVKIWDIQTSSFVTADFENTAYTQDLDNDSIGGGINNAALALAHRIHEETGMPVSLIINAEGGTSIDNWGTGSFTDTLISTVDAALAESGSSDIDAFVWLQGETDLKNGMSFDDYAGHWKSMINALTAKPWFDKTSTPILTAPINRDFIENPDKGVSTDGVQRFLASLSARNTDYGRTSIASPANLGTFDDVHYTGQALYELGYYRLYAALVNINNESGNLIPFPDSASSASSAERQKSAAAILKNALSNYDLKTQLAELKQTLTSQEIAIPLLISQSQADSSSLINSYIDEHVVQHQKIAAAILTNAQNAQETTQ